MTTEPQSPISPDERTQFAVLLFTDICDSTALKAEHGAMAYKRAAELHNALFEKLAAEESLTLIKNTGDGYFARTTSVAAAVRFALRFQHGMRGMAWPLFPLTTRVCIHAGEVADITTLGQADVLAPAADLVARVMGLAVGGQILLTRSPFDEARHFVRAHPDAVEGLSLTWLAHGPYLFKGCTEPVEVFEVGLSCMAPLVAPPDGEKAKRALRPGDEETLGWRPADGLEIPGRPGWRIAGKLGAGGFGEVWAGERDKTHERRAYKFCFDAERLRALKREVTLTRLLRETLGERDDIVRIFDLRLDEPPYFLESELATDGNLLQWAEKMGGLAKIPLTERIELVAATATALAAAHSVGVLHKDIKPTNVLIFTGKDGHARPRLVDFGIGTLADSSVLAQHGITGSGFTQASVKHSSGTPTYSPPEYLAGKAFTVQGDVYSLGVMLYQLVTAQPDAPLAEGWQRDVPDELLREDIALCVDGDPTRRLPSAADLATRLRALDERREKLTTQREAAAVEQARRKRQRQLRFTATTAAIIAAVTVPLALWALREKGNAEKATGRAITNEALAISEKEKAKAQVREASRSDYATAQQRLAEGKWQEAVAYFGRSIRYDAENRNAQDALWLALRYGQRDAGKLPIHVFAHTNRVTSASFSLYGTRIITASEDGTAQLWDAKTGRSIGEPMMHKGAVISASFNRDGTRIVTASHDRTVRVWDAKTGQIVGGPIEHEADLWNANFSSDGTRIVTVSNDGARIYDAKSIKLVISIVSGGSKPFGSAVFNPDGNRIVTATSGGAAEMWDTATGKSTGVAVFDEGCAIESTNFSPNGRYFVTASACGTAQIWDVNNGHEVGVPLKHGSSVRYAEFSPDGSRVVTASGDKTARVWDAMTGFAASVPLKHDGYVIVAKFSPDGTRLVTASDTTARVWDVRTGEQIGATFNHEQPVTDANFSPNSEFVITASADKTARLWGIRSERHVGVPLQQAHFYRAASFSPDGRRIATISSDSLVGVWDINTGSPVGAPIKTKSRVHSMSFSADLEYAVTVSDDKLTRIWETKSGRQVCQPLTHGAFVYNAVISPNDACVVTVGDDGTAQLWDIKTGALSSSQRFLT